MPEDDTDSATPITVDASSLTGGVVWFSSPDSTTALSALTLDPGDIASQNGWRSWPLYIYVAESGCYFLGVKAGSTSTGSFFAAGA